MIQYLRSHLYLQVPPVFLYHPLVQPHQYYPVVTHIKKGIINSLASSQDLLKTIFKQMFYHLWPWRTSQPLRARRSSITLLSRLPWWSFHTRLTINTLWFWKCSRFKTGLLNDLTKTLHFRIFRIFNAYNIKQPWVFCQISKFILTAGPTKPTAPIGPGSPRDPLVLAQIFVIKSKHLTNLKHCCLLYLSVKY